MVNVACADKTIALQLGLSVVDDMRPEYDFLLINTPTGLSLQKNDDVKTQLTVDFLAGELAYRRFHGGGELLIKAVGLNKTKNLTILDVTAGLGRDAFIMACHGGQVTLLERNKIIAALLQDALQRLALQEKLGLLLIQTDSLQYLQQLSDLPDVIYLDPMYPEKRKSALVKKEMQFLQQIITEPDNAEDLLQLALTKAKSRVVVKRPNYAGHLAGLVPNYSVKSKNHRFDIYNEKKAQ